MTGALSYHGLYINLDADAARREAMERQLDALGLAPFYKRFPAIDGATLDSPRATIEKDDNGAFHSHYRALLSARPRAMPVHILEDDALLSPNVRPVIEQAIAQKLFDEFDVLFTDTFVSPHLGMLKFLKSAFDELPATRPLALNDLKVVDLANQNFSGVTSYVVSAKATDRLLALYQQEIALGPRAPVGIFLRSAAGAGQLRAACVFPFITSISLDDVAKGGAADPSSEMVLAALRYSFFVDRDLKTAQRHLDAATGPRADGTDAHRAFVGQALDFVMSERFREF